MSACVARRDGRVLIERVESAVRLPERMRGLLGRHGLAPGHALHLSPCRAIHTCGMRFNLDAVFLSRELMVVRIRRNIPPYRLVFGGRHAYSVLELESGWFAWDHLQPGDPLVLR